MFTVCTKEYRFFRNSSFFKCVVLRCRNLPKMDVIGSCDPYVIAELLPLSLYHKNQKEKRTVVQHDSRNPEYNQLFQW